MGISKSQFSCFDSTTSSPWQPEDQSVSDEQSVFQAAIDDLKAWGQGKVLDEMAREQLRLKGNLDVWPIIDKGRM
jgi:hypothetical protein